MSVSATLAPPVAPGRPAPRRGDRADLRVVPPAPARRRRSYLRLLVAVAAVLGAVCLFGVVVAHVMLTQNQFRLSQLRETSATQQAEYDRLRLEVARLESPSRIVAEAQQRLGMVVPEGVEYLTPSEEDETVESSTLARAGDGDAPGDGAPAPAPDDRTPAGWSTVKPHLAEG
ncbi:MAG TPA: cell division protein FtsL [Acidimicrobiales bacterium]|nr:cell division protein FtsL [Acidimicrobiales bacterium]